MSTKRNLFIVGSVFVALVAILLMFLVVSPTAAQDLATNTPFAEDIAASPVPIDAAAPLPDAVPTLETVPLQPVTINVETQTPVSSFYGLPDDTFIPLVIAITLIILGLVGALAYTQGKSIQALYESLPPNATQLIRGGLETLATKASTTPSPLDDEAVNLLIDRLGYQLTRLDDGRMILVSKPAPVPSNP
jgi:hypothetical protein